MKNKFKNKNVIVIGLKKSGLASISLLQNKGAFCYAYDDNIQTLQQVLNLSNVNIVNKIDDDILKIMDYMIISPGLSIYSEYVKLANLYDVKVIGEVELGSYFTKGKTIAITGTNGKTTITSMIYDALKTAKKPCVLCGNIGEPICENILPFKSNYVLEVSSFQLESSVKFAPDIAVITNITPNHLDRHLNFKNYRQAKFNIFKNMTRHNTLILNYDDKTLRELKTQKLKPKVIWVSAEKEIDGYFLKGTKVFKKKGKKTELIFDLNGIKLIGKHNLLNSVFVVAICSVLKLNLKQVLSSIVNFEPISHRLQFIKDVNGVTYINDSKSTSPDSTITAINAIKKPLILLLGGSDKGTNFDKLAQKIKKSKQIKIVIVQGATTKKIVKSLKKYSIKNFIVAKNFNDALIKSTQLAIYGDTVLLSPACASFDYFDCYEARGEKFIEYVKGINIETKNQK